MRISLLLAFVFASSAAFVPDAARAQSQTATARVQAPADSKCPIGDRSKTATATFDGCTGKACNAARQSAIAKLRGDVDNTCANFIRADSQCTKSGC
jgi:hypothetical protein